MRLHKSIVFFLLALCFVGEMSLAAAPEGEAACRSCHGERGISSIPIVPNLACQQEQYLVNAMLAYRDGRRVDASMSAAVRDMHIGRIEQFAKYYSQQACAAR